VGYYPGKRVGFAGTEARSVIGDWVRSARTGRYEPSGIEADLESGMAALDLPVLAVDMADDWFVPTESLRWLSDKLAGCDVTEKTVSARYMDRKADHYAWMKHPASTADAIARWLDSQPVSE